MKFQRTIFLQNTSEGLLLDLVEFIFYPLNSIFETLENLSEGWWYSQKFHSLKHDWNYSHIKTVTSHRYKVAITCSWLIFCALLSAIWVKICSVYHGSDVRSYRMHWLNSDLKLQRIFVFWYGMVRFSIGGYSEDFLIRMGIFLFKLVSYLNSAQTKLRPKILRNPMVNLHIRSSRPQMFCKKEVLRNFPKFTRKHLRQSLFFK